MLMGRGFTAAALSKPAESIQLQHPRLVSVAQLLFTPILKFPPIANRQDQARTFASALYHSHPLNMAFLRI